MNGREEWEEERTGAGRTLPFNEEQEEQKSSVCYILRHKISLEQANKYLNTT